MHRLTDHIAECDLDINGDKAEKVGDDSTRDLAKPTSL